MRGMRGMTGIVLGGASEDTYDIDTLIAGHTNFGALSTEINTDHRHGEKISIDGEVYDRKKGIGGIKRRKELTTLFMTEERDVKVL